MLRNLRLVHRASYFDECHLSLLAWGQSTQCPVQNRLIVSDSRHQKGVRNFRRIVFHSLFKLKGHVTVSSRSTRGQALTRQRKITRGARACAGPASPQFRTFWAKNKPTSVNERSFVKKVRSWKSQTNNIRMFEHSLQLYRFIIPLKESTAPENKYVRRR